MNGAKKKRTLVKKLILSKDFKDIVPISCGKESCLPSQAWTSVAYNGYILHFVISGKGKFKTARGEYSVGGNEVFVIRPYEIAYYEADEHEPWEYAWICFRTELRMPEIINERDVFSAPYLKDCFLNAANRPDALENAVGYEEFLLAKIWEIQSLVRMQSETSYLRGDYVKRALSIIENEFHTGISVSDIAKRLHLNRSYFTKMFTEAMNRSPGNYLHEMRLNTAANLIRSKNYSAATVALSVGFSDVSSFSRAFKAHFGISPGEYSKKGTEM
jgi:AraC-like DNA-binding protein